MRCKLDQCKCGKTYSNNDGVIGEGICNTCKTKEVKDAENKKYLAERMKSLSKKKKKARKVAGNRLEKFAEFVS